MPPQECPNESGECSVDGCTVEVSPIWYGKKGSKYCKHCYDTALGPKKRSRLSPVEMQAMQAVEQAGDTLVEIIKICGIRSARALEAAPAERARLRLTSWVPCVAVARRTWGEIKPTLLEQRVPVPKEDEKLEYDVYGKFKFLGEPAGVFALGRAWVTIAELATAENWDDDEEEFDARVIALRKPFL